jgi:hypothetical protein
MGCILAWDNRKRKIILVEKNQDKKRKIGNRIIHSKKEVGLTSGEDV